LFVVYTVCSAVLLFTSVATVKPLAVNAGDAESSVKLGVDAKV